MDNFALGLKISKNFSNRGSEDTELLYHIIEEAVDIVQSDDKKHHSTAMGFLVSVYEPYIKKLASKIYKKMDTFVEYEDVLQETRLMFIQLVYRYKKEISSFSYYIKYLLPQHMYVWYKKYRDTYTTPVDTQSLETWITHPKFKEEAAVFEFLNSRILENDYIEFIERRAEKKSRSLTVKNVCYRYFLGSESCAAIAHDLGISYHAVYEIIGKIKKELRVFLHESRYTDYKITSTGEFE
jgi:RNA polymerase sigma factor (sigma-70 family)